MLKQETAKSGFIIINKPSGPTSHDVIDRLRKITGIRKIGHAGTLDPFASGVLLVAIGREATRELKRFVGLDKEYRAVLTLGAVTDTYDKTGEVNLRFKIYDLGLEDIKECLNSFIGEQEQVPPMYSAKKVNGKKLYQYARQGIEIEREPAIINIHELQLISYTWPLLKIKVRCSSGTYIRSLAHAIGERLGCGAYLEDLERTAVGPYRLEVAAAMKDITVDNWTKKLSRNIQDSLS